MGLLCTFVYIFPEPINLRKSFCHLGVELLGHKVCGCSVLRISAKGFPGGAVVENLPANAEDTGSSPGLGGSHMPWSN